MMSTPPQNTPRGGQGSTSPGGSGRTDGEELKNTAKHLAEEAKAEGQARVEGMRDTAAEKADTLAESAQAAASKLSEDDIGHLSEYVSDFADRISTLSTSLRDKSGDEIMRDVGRMARENPALFVTGSILLGFGIARFAKSSQEHGSSQEQQRTDSAGSSYSPYATTSGAVTSGGYAGASGTTAGTTTGTGTGAGSTSAGQRTGASQTPSGTSSSTPNPIRPGADQSGTSSGTQGGIH